MVEIIFTRPGWNTVTQKKIVVLLESLPSSFFAALLLYNNKVKDNTRKIHNASLQLSHNPSDLPCDLWVSLNLFSLKQQQQKNAARTLFSIYPRNPLTTFHLSKETQCRAPDNQPSLFTRRHSNLQFPFCAAASTVPGS